MKDLNKQNPQQQQQKQQQQQQQQKNPLQQPGQVRQDQRIPGGWNKEQFKDKDKNR